MSGVNIEYKGESIATIPDTGSKTIKTQGKYCEGDILVEYEAPLTPSPTLQSKTVTPTTSQQSVTPDSGYDGLSNVTVNATPLEAKTVTPTSQQQVVTPTAPNIGLSSVTVGAAPPPPTLITKQITANGTYSAEDDNADGYNEVTVAVPREITKLVGGTITEYVDDEVTSIRNYAFYNCQNLTTCDCTNATSIGIRAFYGCSNLDNITFTNVETIGQESFKNARLLPQTALFRFDKCKTIDGYEAFFLMPAYSQYRRAIFPALESLIPTAFRGGTARATIATLVFKKEVALTNYNGDMFYIRSGNDDNAKIYVPQRYLNHFQTGTNWAAGYASYPNVVRTIEDNLDYLISIGFTREELLSVEE